MHDMNRMRILWLVALLMLLAVTAPAGAAESTAVRSPRASVTLISDTDAPMPGQPFRLGLRFRLSPGWHIYWRNSGDAGLPPDFSVTLPAGAQASKIAWPTPERLPEGPLMTYGYTGDVLLAVTITPGAEIGPIEATANWLICEKICVPEEGKFHLALASGPGLPAAETPLFVAAEETVPRLLPGSAQITADGALVIASPDIAQTQPAEAWFFPYDPDRITHSKPQPVAMDADRLTLRLSLAERALEADFAGVLVVSDRAGQRSAFSLTASRPSDIPGVPAMLTVPPSPFSVRLPFAQAALFAFLGGLILNLMPCVFPVLAMKAVSLAGLAGQPRRAARQGAAFYTLGILAAFAILASALLATRQAGGAAGWGFQFQSPAFVAVMAWVFFAVGLNLSGVFQVATRLAGVGQTLVMRGGAVGNFATGLLAALVATPCTAPFMGAAIAAALAASPGVTLAVFLAMGLGLAAPYVALVLIPGLARSLPRPGPWMDLLRQILAFPMYAATIWLVWVVSQLLGPSGVLFVLAGALLIGVAGWALGHAQRASRPGLFHALASLALGIALALLPGLAAQPPEAGRPLAAAGVEAFSPARLAALRAAGSPVFVNMTAAWCITCLVNERIALAPAAVRVAFEERKIVYLKGDWTRQDHAITIFLREHGRDGVPLYVFFPAGLPLGKAGHILPQLLTEGTVLAAIAAN